MFAGLMKSYRSRLETSLGVEAREVPFKDGSVTVDVLVPFLSLGAQGFQVGILRLPRHCLENRLISTSA